MTTIRGMNAASRSTTHIRRVIDCAAICTLVLTLSSTTRARADDWFGPDKALHFGISLGISAGGYGASSLFVDSRVGRLAIGGAIGIGAGAGKELYDLSGHGDPSWHDFTWDLLGVATGLGLAWLIDELTGGSDRPPAARDHAFIDVRERRTGLTLSSSSWSATSTSP
jgi:putative lipoprotein